MLKIMVEYTKSFLANCNHYKVFKIFLPRVGECEERSQLTNSLYRSRMAESLDGKHAASDEYRSSLQGSRMSDSLSMACEYYYDPSCEICAKAKKRNVKHEGFCIDCVQFLCKDCLKVHRNLQAARAHLIQRGDDMPKSMADKPPKFDYCVVHQRIRKDQFCGTHKVLICSQCAPLQHKGCPVDSVDNACKGVPSSEIDALYDKVSDFETNVSSVVTQTDLNITELGKQRADLLKDAQDMKDKGIAKIEKLFQEMTSEIESTYKARTFDLGQCKNKLSDVIENLEETLDEINKMKGTTVDTKQFLAIHDILKDVEQCKSDAEKQRTSSMNVKMLLIPDKRMKEFLSTSFKMGLISLDTPQPLVAISVPEISFPMSPARSLPVPQGRGGKTPTGASDQVAIKTTPLPKIKAVKHDNYSVKLDDDKRDCNITDIAITNDGRVLLADYYNNRIKMFSRDMKSLCSLSMSTSPKHIAVTGDREAVVSCYNVTKLLVLDISDRKMSIKGTVELRPFRVAGLAPYNDKLLVITNVSTPSPINVKLIDQSGRVYWSADTDQQGQRLFYCPYYVTFYDDGGSAAVIVSDRGSDTLTVLNADTGDVITRRHVEGKGPRGVTTDAAGNLYVCYYETDEVAVLTKDLSQENVLLSKGDRLSSPYAIVYSAVDQQLLVSNTSGDSRNTVDCFKLQ